MPASPSAAPASAASPLAFIGLGGMGSAMALRLIDRGFAVSVYNRTAAKTAPLAEAGARVMASPARAAAGRPVVLVSLSDETAVEEIVFGQLSLSAGTILIDTSTVSPGYARSAAARLKAMGVRRVECCVLGNPELARAGGSRILVAGMPRDVETVRPILRALGRQIVEVGGAGAAATMKLVFNMLLGVQVASLAEAVNYGERAGLDRDELLTNIAGSGFSSMVMAFRAQLMRTRAYDPPAFRAWLMAKDLRLASAEAAAAGVPLPIAGLAREIFEGVVAAGDGDKDAAIVIEHGLDRAVP
jgi:3-hydroxyisobutyrate dehydrogenase-like beta-hydroxyacid dehydrogenase